MSKNFWFVITTLIIGLSWFLWIGNDSVTEPQSPSGNEAVVKHSIGKEAATVTLVEYSDFQCSACSLFYPVVDQVIEKYKDRISFEYRHYPLASIHRNAIAAARASEAAGKQGKFWEMYRLLFADQLAWSESSKAQTTFEGYAQQLGLDLNRYNADFASDKTNNSINASIQEFNKRGLPKSTPTFLLNDKKIEPQSLEDFSKLIDEELKTISQ